MEGVNCGGTGGWTRIGFVDMTESGATCPEGLDQQIVPGVFTSDICHNSIPGCASAFFPSYDISYQEVCGQLRGYQIGSPEAFARSILVTSLTIDDQYLDGVSITHGSSPRTHIWSYAVGATTGHTNQFGCPCNMGSTVSPPPFVGDDYYCESAAENLMVGVSFPSDILWDGDLSQCTGSEGPCCSLSPNLPWFTKTLPATTSDNIELRMCQDESIGNENVVLDLIELFIR